ncbi:MAG: hypothetical protein JNM12_12760 [Alphaproteobacteria bacterium]|nr:hypothetical protein [Alphaproteobacteria bacterium]
MIESISTLSVQSSVLRYQPQSNTDSAQITPAVSAPELGTSRIRVDNLQNIAILEVISEEGDVIRQYPSESQIKAFKRAESLIPASDNTAPQITADKAKQANGFAVSAPDEGGTAPAPQARSFAAPQTYAPSGNAGGTTSQPTQSLIA